ncbi:hypothetical protein DH2020_028080 [Rehmannia glutinosa]|uniref:Nicalin n=1 Tax=Rehmannia glutinosa TaxID=99300 RepID=A0ABR0VV53_REHGL
MAKTQKSQHTMFVEPVYSSLITLLIIVVACAELCDAVTVVDVYRLVQYDLGGVPLGSRLAALNHHAGSSLYLSSAGAAADLSRTVLILPVRELNLTFIRVFSPQHSDSGGGADQDSAKDLVKEVLIEVERLLIHANIPYPVYFGFEDEAVHAMLGDVKKNDITGQPATATTGGCRFCESLNMVDVSSQIFSYKLVVAAPEPRKVASPAIINIQGWLPGLKADGDSNQLPTIAIVASYDTFGAAPALSVGSDSNGSGVVALLEIARLFSILYSNPKTRGRYNLLFVLTSGGPYNYNGTHKWLRSMDQRLRETIDYAICLNSIGSSSNELWLHVSKPPENAYIKQIFEGFSTVSEELGLKVGLKHKKINISNPRRHIYGQQGKRIDIFADHSSLSINPSYIRSWVEFLSTTPRVAPFLSKSDPLIVALKKELADHTVEVNVQQELLDGMFTFYDSTSGRLHIYQGLDDLISLFRRPSSRKVKTA